MSIFNFVNNTVDSAAKREIGIGRDGFYFAVFYKHLLKQSDCFFGCRKGLLASIGNFYFILDLKHHVATPDIVTLPHFGLMPGEGELFFVFCIHDRTQRSMRFIYCSHFDFYCDVDGGFFNQSK